jgi:hypothetical protein
MGRVWSGCADGVTALPPRSQTRGSERKPQKFQCAPSLVEPAHGRAVGSEGRSSSAIHKAEKPPPAVGRMNDVLFDRVVRGQAEKAVEFFLERGTAEVMICEFRSDEPVLMQVHARGYTAGNGTARSADRLPAPGCGGHEKSSAATLCDQRQSRRPRTRPSGPLSDGVRYA